MSTKVGVLLEQLMLDAGVDDTRLSQATKIAKANISRLKNDPKANPTLATLKPLAAFFGVTVSQLLGEAPLSGDKVQGQVRCRIPVLPWSSINNFLADKHFSKADEWISMEEKMHVQAFGIIVSDKTLAPIFPLGALLIVEPQQEYTDGMYVLIEGIDGGEPFLRQYLVDGNLRFLKSIKLGSNWGEPLTKQMKIIGSVIEIRYRMEGLG